MCFNKYVITYQNLWRKDVVRPHLAESTYCKTLGPLKGAPTLHHFIQKKIFLVVFLGESAVRSPGKQGNLTLIHPISYKPQIFTNLTSQYLVDKYMITYQSI